MRVSPRGHYQPARVQAREVDAEIESVTSSSRRSSSRGNSSTTWLNSCPRFRCEDSLIDPEDPACGGFCSSAMKSGWGRMQACMESGERKQFDGPTGTCRPPLYDAGEMSVLDARGAKISPYTQGLVVVNRRMLPEPMFRRIRFTNPEQYSRLVTEVEYTTSTGDIHYDIEKRDDITNDAYARLVTLNWWYQQLFYSLILACVTIANSFSNIVFCVNCFTEARLRFTVPLATRLIFVILFVVTEYFILRKCGIEVNKEWVRKADPNRVGDLITGEEVNAIDRKMAWAAMFCFKFIHLDAIVKDVIIWLHPWKSVQPYGAFKADGHRCYIVGWASEYMYRCENKQGQEEFLSQQLFLVGILCTFKINVIVESGSFAPLLLALPSVINFFVIAFRHWALLNDRLRHWEWLCNQRNAANGYSDYAKAIEKQKSTHFPNIEWRSKLRERRVFAFRTSLSVMIPAVLGIIMHIYDSNSPEHRASVDLFTRCFNLTSHTDKNIFV